MEILPDKETIAYRKASRRVKDLKEFYGNLTSYGIVIPFLAILNLVTAPGYLWFLWPALGWGVGIAFHAISVFGIGKSWEEKKIKELMEKEEKSKIKTF